MRHEWPVGKVTYATEGDGLFLEITSIGQRPTRVDLRGTGLEGLTCELLRLAERVRELETLLERSRKRIELEWGRPEKDLREALGVAPDTPI